VPFWCLGILLACPLASVIMMLAQRNEYQGHLVPVKAPNVQVGGKGSHERATPRYCLQP
jgi:hypothetical protein